MVHKFMKAAGCKTEKEFYSKYPSEDHFFADYPHMKGNQTMQNGGAASGHSDSYWNGERWVSTAGDSGTYAGGTYFRNGGNYSKMGGPTFMPGGSAPLFYAGGATQVYPFAMNPGPGYGTGMLEEYDTEHMENGGHIPGGDIVDPFAMWPGSGKGGGFLQDLPTEMKRGGRHKGGKRKLTPAQMQMMMAAMQQQQQPMGPAIAPQGPPMQQPMMLPPVDGLQQPMIDQQQMQQQSGGQPIPGMKKGGIHIKKSHEGLFTKKAKAAGMGVQEYAHHVMAHSNNPVTRKQANFAIQAAKWKHEYGGTAMPDNPGFRALPSAVQQKIMNNMQTGGMITPDRMVYEPGGEYQNGGQANPYANMAIGQMSQMQHKLGELGKVLNQNTDLEPWVASKMTLANDYLNSVENYLEHNPEAQSAMAYGGIPISNPFHPLSKFARGGYYLGGGSTDDIYGTSNTNNPTNIVGNTQQSSQGITLNTPNSFQNNWQPISSYPSSLTSGTNTSGLPEDVQSGRNIQQQKVTAETGWEPIEESDIAPKEYLAPDSPYSTSPAQNNKKTNKRRMYPYGTGFNNLLAGAIAASNFIRDRNDARSLAAYNRSAGLTKGAVNPQGAHGDYDISGMFRPDQYVPTAAGAFYSGYPSSGQMSYGPRYTQMGGNIQTRDNTFANGGYYEGQELDLTEDEIENLQRMGYKFDIV